MANPILTSDLLKNEGDLLKAIEELVRLRTEYNEFINDIKKNATTLKNSIPKITNSKSSSFGDFAQNQAKLVDNLSKTYAKYTDALTENGKKLAKARKDLKELNRVQALNRQITESAVGSHKRLSAQHSLELIKLKKLSGAVRENTAEGKKQVALVKSLSDQLKKIEKSYGSNTRNVGNYQSATKKLLGTLKQLAAVYLSVEGIRRFGRLIFETTKDVNSLNSAYSFIIPSERNRAETMEVLSDLAERYGVNINVLRGSYLRFTAATKSSNLTLEQRQQIFEKLTKATTALELGSQKTSRVFNAIEQIMSKGVVSSEELRQQLGDSLPGSLEIMAKALGVTTFELGKMLKKGEVLAEDAIPKFAAELEKAYGLESVNKIDNLSTAQGRFETAIINTISKLEASTVFKDMFDKLTNIVTVIGDNINIIISLVKAVGYLGAAYVTYNTTLKISTILSLRDSLAKKGLTTVTRLLSLAQLSLNKAMKENPIGLVLTAVVLLYGAYDVLTDSLSEAAKKTKRLNDVKEEITISTEKEKLNVDKLFKSIIATNTPMEERNRAYKELKRLYPQHLKNIDLETASISELKAAQILLNKEIEKSYILKIKNTEADKSYDVIAKAKVRIAKINKEGFNALEGSSILGLGYTGEKGHTDPLRLGGRKKGETGEQFAIRSAIEDLNTVIDGENEFLSNLDDFYSNILGGRRKSGRGSSPLFDSTGNKITKSKDKGETEVEKKKRIEANEKLFNDELKQRELNANLIENQYEKELELLDIKQTKETALYKKHNADVEKLTKEHEKQVAAVHKKFTDRRVKEIKKIPTLEAKAVTDTYENEIKQFDLKQKLAKSEFDLLVKSERDKTKFVLEQEEKRLLALIKLKEKYNQPLSNKEKAILQNQAKAKRNAINELDNDLGEDFNIYEKLGFSKKKEEAIRTSFSFAKEQLTEYVDLRKELADKRVDAADREVSAAENALNREIQYHAQGFASNIAQKEKELAASKRLQKKAQKEQEKARKIELASQSVQQGVNLITASSKILADAPAFAPVLIPLMFATFVASKVKALQLTKKKFSKGGYEKVGGGTHDSGNDTYLGFEVQGQSAFAEKDEGHMILRPEIQRKYSNTLPLIYNALDNGVFFEQFGNNITDSSLVINASADMSKTEQTLTDIKNQNSVRGYVDGDGNTIEYYKNVKTTYV